VIGMRLTLALSLVAVVACSKHKDDQPVTSGPQPVENAPIKAVKHDVSKQPLPALATDTGGATGKPIWQLGFGGDGIDVPRGVAVGANNEVYVAGYFEGTADFGGPVGKKTAVGGSDGFLTKLTADGKMAWMQQFGSKRDDDAKAVATRGDRVVVVGNFLDEIKAGEYTHKAVGSDDLFAVAYDKDGVAQWLWTLGGIDSDGANAVAASPDGGWIIGGSYTDTITIGSTVLKAKGKTDAILVKLDASGDMQWVKTFGGRYDDTVMRVAVDSNNNIYVAGHFADVSDWGGPQPLKAHGGSDNDIVLAKYDTNGDYVWAKNFGNMFNDVAGGLAVDPAGHITLVGSFENKGSISFGEGDEHVSLGEADAYIARFTSDGKLEWAHTFGAERVDVAFGVATDAAGNTVTVGWFENIVDFGKGAVASKGNKDMFAVKLDAKGNVVWVNTWGDHDHDQARGVALDDKGNAIVVGAYRFKLELLEPAIEGHRPENDPVLSKAPKPDVAVVKFAR
jgi:hypothetical protein